MRPVISYEFDNCKKCIRCIKTCPVDAISIVNEKVTIDNKKCINCGKCIQVCEEKVLKVKKVDIEKALKEHSYNVVLIPSALISDIKQYNELNDIASALKAYGFDEVVQYSDIEGFLYEKAIEEYTGCKEVKITSFCPVINRLIRNEYPTLLDNIVPYDYPVEIAAKELRKKYKDLNIGIFSLCECVGKLTLAHAPFGRNHSNIDYAISFSSILPIIKKLGKSGNEILDLNETGVKSVVSHLCENKDLSMMSVSGYEQVRQALDLIEFDQLDDVDVLSLFYCHQGCIGGCYLWGNPFKGRLLIKDMLKECKKPIRGIDREDYYWPREVDEDDQIEFKERMAWFNKVNAILETLPHYDCGSCGFANCRALASKIASGEVDDSLCRLKSR